uniref:von Willebrand factor A domain-containing protein 3A n=1 Tax=Schistosoma haematobium TaxID=6185 RepID=A0A094ZQE5_SCHHA
MNFSAQVVVIHDVTFHEIENYGYCLGASISKTEGLTLFLRDQANLKNRAVPGTSPRREKPKWDSKFNANLYAFASPDDQFLRTKLHHYYELNEVKSKNIRAEESVKQSTNEWLENYGLKAKRLTLDDFIAMGKIPDGVMEEFSANSDLTLNHIVDGFRKNLPSHLEYNSKQVNQFECGLHESIFTYTNRIRWLMEDTRKIFGLIRGENIGLLLDSSDANLGFNRDKQFKEHLMELVNEQITADRLKTLYVASYGTNINSLWPYPMCANSRAINELKYFIREQLIPMGGSNLLSGIKHMIMFGRKQLDVIIIICGSYPDQPAIFIQQYLEQIFAGFTSPRLHLVAYDCRNPEVNQLLAQLATIKNDFIYHCYLTENESAVYTSDEIARLLKEINDAQKVLEVVGHLRQEMESSSTIAQQAIDEVNMVSNAICNSPVYYLPQPTDTSLLHGKLQLDHLHRQCCRQWKPFQPTSSQVWLHKHGLKARKLNLFQILAPNAYSQVVGYVPSIQRSVSAQIHEKCMVQVRWLDGSIKNVHVDPNELYKYQTQITNLVGLLEKRIHWLTQKSRGYFGTLIEPNVIILIDLSGYNTIYMVHIHYCLRHLLEEQISTKSKFNLMIFGSDSKAYQSNLIDVNANNLQASWDWFKTHNCSGSRNLLSALRLVFESQSEKDLFESHLGIYIFTSGIPDQDSEVISSYLEAKRCTFLNTHVHVALYHVDNTITDKHFPCRYANITETANSLREIAHSTPNGRFHWFRENGIIESDDVRVLLDEIDEAVSYSKQAQLLVASITDKRVGSEVNWNKSDKSIVSKSSSTANQLMGGWDPSNQIEPRLNLLTLARKEAIDAKMKSITTDNDSHPKALTWYQEINNTDRIRSNPMKSKVSGRKKSNTLVKPIQIKRFNCQIPTDEERVVKALKRYVKRYEWLTTGSRKYFGLICEECIVILIDTSGSMDAHLNEIKTYLKLLIWEQLHKNKVFFNMVSFSSTLLEWQASGVVMADEIYCHDAIAWIDQLKATGGTCTGEAILCGLNHLQIMNSSNIKEMHDVNFNEMSKGIYLITDGKPDVSCSSLIKNINEVWNLTPDSNVDSQNTKIARTSKTLNNTTSKKDKIKHTKASKLVQLHKCPPIHTISYTNDQTALLFLKKLSNLTNGRFHTFLDMTSTINVFLDYLLQSLSKMNTNENDNRSTYQKDILSFPNIQSDDIRLIQKEIRTTYRTLICLKYFQDVYKETKLLRK